MGDPFQGVSGQLNGSVYDMVPVTPNDNADNVGADNIAIGLYITTGGAVTDPGGAICVGIGGADGT